MYAYSPVPYMDDWDANLTFVMDVRDGAAHAWWQQHNEHRIVLTRLLLYPTMTVLGGHQWLLSLVSMASVATGGWLFAAIARQGRGTRPLPQAWRPWIAVLTGVLWLWSQHETLEWGLNVAFVLAVLAPTAALWVQGRGAAGQRATTRGEHAVAAGLGLTAALTVAGGLLALPVLALRAWLVRASWRVVGAYALLGMLGAAVYLTDYVTPPSSGSPVVTMLTSPLKVGAFVSLFLGGSLRWLIGEGRLATIAGGLAGSAYVVAWLRTGWLLRRREQAHHAAASLWCLATYVLLMAMLAAAGRIQVFGLFSATASRYNTLALWGWVALGVLALQFGWVRSGPWSARRRFVVATACALITARQAVSVLQAFEPRPDRARAGLALALHVDDLQAIEAVYPDPARAIAIARRSEQQGIGFLARPPYAGLREQLGTRRPGAVLPGCAASIALTGATPTPGTLQRVTGRVWAPVLPDDTQPVAVVDSDVVVGFVTVERGGFATPLVDRTSADLVGYAALSPSSRPMLAWAGGHCTGTLETDD